MFHEKTSCLDLEQFPPTSNATKLHIYRAYFQAYIWYHAAIENTINIHPKLYGFTCNNDENLVPIINDASQLPADYPFPYKFGKRCPCRLKELACGQYCNCENNCLNPL